MTGLESEYYYAAVPIFTEQPPAMATAPEIISVLDTSPYLQRMIQPISHSSPSSVNPTLQRIRLSNGSRMLKHSVLWSDCTALEASYITSDCVCGEGLITGLMCISHFVSQSRYRLSDRLHSL